MASTIDYARILTSSQDDFSPEPDISHQPYCETSNIPPLVTPLYLSRSWCQELQLESIFKVAIWIRAILAAECIIRSRNNHLKALEPFHPCQSFAISNFVEEEMPATSAPSEMENEGKVLKPFAICQCRKGFNGQGRQRIEVYVKLNRPE